MMTERDAISRAYQLAEQIAVARERLAVARFMVQTAPDIPGHAQGPLDTALEAVRNALSGDDV